MKPVLYFISDAIFWLSEKLMDVSIWMDIWINELR